MTKASKPTPKPPVTRGVRVGGRSKRVVEAVLQAAVQELARSGYAAFQVEEVAQAAGVNRTSIYRRWPTKAILIEAALREVRPFSAPQPGTGSLPADLLAISQQLVTWMRSAQGRTLMRTLMRNVDQPELERLAKKLADELLAPWLSLIEAAKAGGQLAPHIDAYLFLQMILAPVTVRLERGEPVNTRVLTALIDIAVAGASPERRPARARRPRAQLQARSKAS